MNKSKHNTRQRIVFFGVLSVLLILRIPLESWLEYLIPSTSEWVEPVYDFGTYALIAFLIWWEREQLVLYHIDYLSVIIIIIFKPLSVILAPLFMGSGNPYAIPQQMGILYLIIAIILLRLVVRKKIAIGKSGGIGFLWFIIGGITGIVFYVMYFVFMIKWLNFPVPPYPGMLALAAPVYQLGYTANVEEPVFRGFLWGGLKSFGLKEYWILVIQAFLFSIAHIQLLNTEYPILFFCIMFINAILMGLLVWRSRSLASSMAFHAFANGSAIVQYWVYSFLFR